jgi:hypothetical protein
MNAEQHRDGLNRIHRAIEAGLHSRAVKAATVGFKLCGPGAAPNATFDIFVGGKSVEKLFTFEEIEDSHTVLRPDASMKIRQFVDEIVPG